MCRKTQQQQQLWQRNRNHMESYRVSTVDVPESSIVNRSKCPWQRRCDSLHYHEEWWGSVPLNSATCFTQSLKTFLYNFLRCIFRLYNFVKKYLKHRLPAASFPLFHLYIIIPEYLDPRYVRGLFFFKVRSVANLEPQWDSDAFLRRCVAQCL